MKKVNAIALVIAMILSLCACGQNVPTWQEQYDLGVRYLSEGNYEEAIIAFTAAIEIDPNRAEAYVGRGDAYGAEDNLIAALADYEKALELDKMQVSAYLGLADIYIQRGETEKAREILKRALETIGEDERIRQALSEITTYNKYGGVEFTERYGYRDSESLTKQEISWLETAFSAAANFDEAALEKLAIKCMNDTDDQGFGTLRTIWNGYKVELSGSHSYYDTPSLNGEFRPENGVGYSFSVDTPGEPTGVIGSSYSGGSRLASCQCVDWQWNGMATIIDYDIMMDTYEVDRHLLSTSTVPMVNSLRDGDYVQDYTYFTTITTYSEGLPIAHDGEPYQQESEETLWSIIAGHFISEHIKDELYW